MSPTRCPTLYTDCKFSPYLGSGSKESAGSWLRGAGRGSEGEGGLGGGGGGSERSKGRFGGRRLPEGPGLGRRGRPKSPERRLRGGRCAETCERVTTLNNLPQKGSSDIVLVQHPMRCQLLDIGSTVSKQHQDDQVLHFVGRGARLRC